MVRLHAWTKNRQQKVPLWGRDITWTVEGDTSVVQALSANGAPPAEGPIFSTTAAGKVTLVGSVAPLGRTIRVKLSVTPWTARRRINASHRAAAILLRRAPATGS